MNGAAGGRYRLDLLEIPQPRPYYRPQLEQLLPWLARRENRRYNHARTHGPMPAESPAPAADSFSISWPAATLVLFLCAFLMLALGAVVVPIGRFALHAAYGVIEIVVLNPLGIALPRAAAFVLANVALLAAALAAGRRVGGLLAIQSVERRLGSDNLVLGLAAIAGLAGAAGFAAVVPWPAAGPDQSPLRQAGYVLVGYVLYVPVLALGPLRGVSLYFESHPRCPSCWVWMQRETGGGSFSEDDLPRLRAALAADDFDALLALPLADPGARGRSCILRWWKCHECHREAFLTCAPVSDGRVDAPVATVRLRGERIQDLRDLIRIRRTLADRAGARHA